MKNKYEKALSRLKGNPVKLLQELINHHYLFHDSLEDCFHCVEETASEVHDMLMRNHGKPHLEFQRTLKDLRDMQQSEEAKDLLNELVDMSVEVCADECDMYAILGLLVGLRFGGMSPEDIDKEVTFITNPLTQATET